MVWQEPNDNDKGSGDGGEECGEAKNKACEQHLEML